MFKPQTLPCLVVPAAGRHPTGGKRDIYYPIASECLASGLQEAFHHQKLSYRRPAAQRVAPPEGKQSEQAHTRFRCSSRSSIEGNGNPPSRRGLCEVSWGGIGKVFLQILKNVAKQGY